MGAASPDMDEDCLCAARSIVNARDTEEKGKRKRFRGRVQESSKEEQ